MVASVHKEYIDAGAQIITANTFRTNPAAFNGSESGADFRTVAGAGVKIALKAAGAGNIFVAGSNAPAEDCYKKERDLTYDELTSNHANHIKLLYVSGSDLILNETQSHMDEIGIICKICSAEHIPFIISLYVDDMLRILSGEPVFEVIKMIRQYAPLAIGFNCVTFKTVERILSKCQPDYPWGAYMNCGSGSIEDKEIRCGISPSEYAEKAKKLLKYSPAFLGACCGSSPEHIRELKNKLDSLI
jgi:homocysteine S-methyltransferase